MNKRYMNLALLIFTVLFYGYHVKEFGLKSIISIMSLASCLSLMAFLSAFFKVGNIKN